MGNPLTAPFLAMPGSLASFVLISALGGTAVSMAHADVLVTRQADTISLEAHKASTSEVLTALGATFELRPADTAFSRPLTGTYNGSTRQIIARVLEGYDYVVKGSDGALTVIIYGISKTDSNALTTTKAAIPGAAQGDVAKTRPTPTQDTTALPTMAFPPASVRIARRSVGGVLEASPRNQIIDNEVSSVPAATRPPNMTLSQNAGGPTAFTSGPANQSAVVGILGAAARTLIANDAENNVPTASRATAAKVDMGALTRSAVGSLQSLAAALGNQPPK